MLAKTSNAYLRITSKARVPIVKSSILEEVSIKSGTRMPISHRLLQFPHQPELLGSNWPFQLELGGPPRSRLTQEIAKDLLEQLLSPGKAKWLPPH